MSETSPCPRCGAPGSGNFCPNCGASRGVTTCPACGHTPEAGARFCTRCGSPMSAAAPVAPGVAAAASPGTRLPSTRAANLGWWAAGVALVALILIVSYPVLSGAGSGGPAGGSPTTPALDPTAVDLNSMTPREAADRLYNRVMEAASASDSAQARMFLPMAIAAYERARPLDEDGRYHLSALQRLSGDAEAALATAEEALADSPEHLLALGAAAEAAQALGEGAQARGYWSRFLAARDAEIAAGREEYRLHSPLLDDFVAQARSLVGG